MLRHRRMKVAPEKKKSLLVVVLGWVFSLGLLGLAFYVVPIREVWEAVRLTSPPALIVASLIVSLSIVMRGWRMASIFRVRESVSVFQCWRITSMGLAINGVVPGRIGDFTRIGMAMRAFKTDAVFTLTTVIIERVLDAVTLLSFVGVAFLIAGFEIQQGSVEVMENSVSSEQLFGAVRWIAITVCAVFLGFVLLFREKVIGKLLEWSRAVPFVGRRLSEFAGNAVDTLTQVVSSLRNARTIAQLGTLCLAIWLPVVICNYVVALGFEGLSLTVGQALAVTAVSIAVSSLPSAPGAWGVFEAGVFLILKAMKLPVDDVLIVGYAFTTHACQYVMVMLLGAASFALGAHEGFRAITMREG